MTYPAETDRVFLLLSGDSVHCGFDPSEVVDSMRQAMFTVPATLQKYMQGVAERVRTLGLGSVDIRSFDGFLKSLIGLGLAEWVSKSFVDSHFGVEIKKKKHDLDWIIRRIPG